MPTDDDIDTNAHKDEMISFRVPKHIADKARARAGGRSIADLLRSFLAVFGVGEYPAPPSVEFKRAKQRPPKKKAPPPPPPKTKTKKRR